MSFETQQEGGREGLFSALKNLLATLLSVGKTRAELLVTEIEEEKLRLMSLWAKAIGAAFLLAMGLIMLVACVAMAFWEQRVWVFGLFAALFVMLGLGLVGSLRHAAQKPSKLFQGSLSELEADLAALKGKDAGGA